MTRLATGWNRTGGSACRQRERRLAVGGRSLRDPDGRGERIRTSDPLHPMQVRYQAAPRPELGSSN